MIMPTTDELQKGLITNIIAMVIVALAIKHSSTIRGILK